MGFDAKRCPFCGTEMTPPRWASYLTTVDDPTLPLMKRHMKVLIYTCEACRYVAMFAPPSPVEEFEKRQTEEQAITDPVEKFMYNFRDYPRRKAAKGRRRQGLHPGGQKSRPQSAVPPEIRRITQKKHPFWGAFLRLIQDSSCAGWNTSAAMWDSASSDAPLSVVRL